MHSHVIEHMFALMNTADLHRAIDELAALTDGTAPDSSGTLHTLDREGVAAALSRLGGVRAWCDHLRIGLVRRMAELSPTPERDVADADGSSSRDVTCDLDRSTTIDALPDAGDALAEGELTAGHLDALGTALRSLEPGPMREEFRRQSDQLLVLARTVPVDQFRRLVRVTVERIRRAAGQDRLAQQRRDARLRTRIDPHTGMWELHGRFDPLTGVRLQSRLDEIREALHAGGVDDSDAPHDPLDRQAWLAAQAFVQWMMGTAPASRRPEVTVVIDQRGRSATAPESSGGRSTAGDDRGMGRFAPGVVDIGQGTIDWGLPIEIPQHALEDLAMRSVVHRVVVDGGEVVEAPGQMRLGRSSRLASADQRRVLRALYPRCAIPDCPVPFHQCDIHHVVPWEAGGVTDLDNLLPVCNRHHQRLHAEGWGLLLHPDRTLTIDLPDGRTLVTAPPERDAA